MVTVSFIVFSFQKKNRFLSEGWSPAGRRQVTQNTYSLPALGKRAVVDYLHVPTCGDRFRVARRSRRLLLTEYIIPDFGQIVKGI